MHTERQDQLTQEFTERLLILIREKTGHGPRTYGFEYEFISQDELSLDDMERLYEFLPTQGFSSEGASFISPSGVRVAFEPGGQIEYCSPALFREDEDGLRKILNAMKETNRAVYKALGIDYVPRDYIPGRAHSPLCLNSKRYINLHARMIKAGTRGLEMMKGTASIHLHVGIQGIQELLPLFLKLAELSKSSEFGMSSQRRDIWDNTDPTRCGLPLASRSLVKNSEEWLKEFVHFTLNAVDLDEKVPFRYTKNHTLQGFLNHMTTIFTDVRLNMKGPTLELRTPGTIPLEQFPRKWKTFVNVFSGGCTLNHE